MIGYYSGQKKRKIFPFFDEAQWNNHNHYHNHNHYDNRNDIQSVFLISIPQTGCLPESTFLWSHSSILFNLSLLFSCISIVWDSFSSVSLQWPFRVIVINVIFFLFFVLLGEPQLRAFFGSFDQNTFFLCHCLCYLGAMRYSIFVRAFCIWKWSLHFYFIRIFLRSYWIS